MSIDVEALKSAVDLVALVGHYTPLRKRGKEFVGRCVAHTDNNPSMWVNPDKRIVHCFSCDFHADAIDFIQHVEGLDFKGACERLGAKNDWQPKIASAAAPEPKPERVTCKPPADAGTPNFNIRTLGEPTLIFPIRDVDSAVLGYECRYAGEGGKKEIRMWTWGARGDAKGAWGCGHFTAPRPLYGLERLSDPKAPVSIFEGPKKAEAGKRLLPPYACISWTGGANAWHKHDWKPIAGRNILLWPDADEPGWTACEKLAALLADPRGLACSVRIVDTNRMPEGWDVADAEAEGWDTVKLIEWAKPRARDWLPPAPPPPEPPKPEAPQTAPTPPKKPRLAVVGNTALAPDPDAEPLPASMSEDMLAEQFGQQHAANWRYVRPWNCWFQWRDDGWYKDEKALIDRLAVELTRQALYWPDAAQLTPDSRRRVNSRRTAGSVRDLAQSDRRIAGAVDQWDVNPWLLGVPGGVVDLKTGKLGQAQREHYITKRTSVAPAEGDPELWLSFLSRITGGDDGLLEYLQRYAGYSLTGITSEHALAFLYGTGANGKTTFVHTLAGIFGDYAMSAGFEVFAESKGADRHPTEIARLRGARLVITEETDAGGRWNEGRVKRLTGGGKISAHFMRQDDFEFEPQFKLLIAGNHKPVIKAVDEAIKRRIHLLPFTITIPAEERDKQLLEKLRAEWPQILQWAIDGCMQWQAKSLSPCKRITDATEQYVEQEDILGAWLDECCEREGESDGKTLYENYKRWCENQGEHSWSRRGWSNAMRERGFGEKRTASARMFLGVSTRMGANL